MQRFPRPKADCPVARKSFINYIIRFPCFGRRVRMYTIDLFTHFFSFSKSDRDRPKTFVQGYEAVKLKSDSRTNYRLVLSDGVHMNSYFYLSSRLNDLILQKQVEHGTMLRINNYSFTAGENCTDHSPRL